MSSSAIIPVTLKSAKKNKTNEDIADFVIPLGATALMIGLYLANDSFGTVCNVTGDVAIAMFIDGLREKFVVEAKNI